MRQTAHFPAGDIQLLKKKLIYWAGNFSVSICLDRNSYFPFSHGDEFMAAAGVLKSADLQSVAFGSLKSFSEKYGGWKFGFLSYDLKNETEPAVFKESDRRFDGIGFPSFFIFEPESLVRIQGAELIIESEREPDMLHQEIQQTAVTSQSSAITKIHSRTSKEEYVRDVLALKSHLERGDLYEVNYCQEFYAENAFINPAELFCRLNYLSPAPFACFVRHHHHHLLCASPERFMAKQGKRIFSQPMKGTIRRHTESHELDMKLKEELQLSEKERAENVMIVDLVRNDLAKCAEPGSVTVDELFGVYSFPSVHQMVSTVSATLRSNIHFVDAIKGAFPMGSMTGAPKVMAMQLIDRYEKVKRGLFSGAVGFVSPDGDFDFNVVIRSILYNAGTGYLSFQAGSAITFESDPEKEYEECLLKAEGMKRAILDY